MSGIGGFPKPGGGSGGGGITPSPFMETVLDDPDAAAARATLQIPQVDRDPVNRLVSGGGVVWESGYTFRVAAALYYINGTLYESAEQTVALAAADASNPRIDVLVLDDTGTLDAITGTPAATANEPDIDPTQQLRLTFVLVDAATLAPAGISNEVIYAENAEWTGSVSGSGFNPDSTLNPFAGSKSIEGTDVATGAWVEFDKGSDVLLDPDGVLVMRVRSKGAWGKSRALRLQWYNGTVAVGAAVTLGDGYWGFDSSITGAYQLVAIPVAQFGQAAGAAVDTLRFTCARGTMGFHIDGVALQESGGSLEAPPNNYLTQDAADTRYLRTAPQTWDFNFTGDADAYILANAAMTVTEIDTTGTGTVAYEKSTAAAPDTFSSTTSPVTLEDGAKLKVTASSVTGSFAVHLERTQ